MKILYFGEIADKTNKTEELLNEIKSLSSLINYLEKNYQLEKANYQIAVNQDLVDENSNENLKATDEIAILSAFAGG